MMLDNREIVEFKNAKDWRSWMEVNHERYEGVWLRLYKKLSGVETVTHEEALDEALCFGWIDGLGKTLDDKSWILKFTPRRIKSIWSKRNCSNVERLIEEGKMTEFGLKEIERAKIDGRWEAAYDPPTEMMVPSDFIEELKKDKVAYDFFEGLNKSNKYAIGWRLQTAKRPETRQKRFDALIKMLKEGQKIHL